MYLNPMNQTHHRIGSDRIGLHTPSVKHRTHTITPSHHQSISPPAHQPISPSAHQPTSIGSQAHHRHGVTVHAATVAVVCRAARRGGMHPGEIGFDQAQVKRENTYRRRGRPAASSTRHRPSRALQEAKTGGRRTRKFVKSARNRSKMVPNGSKWLKHGSLLRGQGEECACAPCGHVQTSPKTGRERARSGDRARTAPERPPPPPSPGTQTPIDNTYRY